MTLPPVSALQSAIPVAETMAAAARVRAMRAQGLDVIALTLGEPDFASPEEAVAAAHNAALAGETRYPAVGGTSALKEAIRAKFLRDNGLEFSADEILVGNGARQIIFDALIATLDPGSEVIIPTPYWNAYPLLTRMGGGVPVFVPCRRDKGFLPRPESLAAAVTPNTRWLVLNFPNNPSGAVARADDLVGIARAMAPHEHVWIMADDMYEHLVLDGSAHVTLAQVAAAACEPALSTLARRVLTISGVSKTYAMPGWRVGFAGGAAELIAAMAKVQGQATGGVSPMAQAAAAAALNGQQHRVAGMRAVYASRCDTVYARLADIPGIFCHRPAAAFYLFPDVSAFFGKSTSQGRLIYTDEDFCAALLDEAHVAAVHGTAFGSPGHIRISTAAADNLLDEACTRIARFCAGIS